ncbi:MAG: Short-chain dehydrogenase/reductase SDR [Methanomicrobiales archaeon 53_19]|uniref:3-oxoacyl-ACP reductase family protein n=1 Tax=Methanocalculus sp. TaxID=2004547 RepID=UPI0007474612|nr:3-oxoacyl-ACP reductase family protein [Methanocalculus sp.]KUL02512.1 MAG: Short-chain dehydrogenase/reductase SDR [Methanomicrobiales archaeon 53_19]HIJ05688.1 3-oxoacyl-ACP reductase FabG [Methanocalculus sp.]
MLNNKVMLITGASRGIGRATALLAAANHAKVIVNYHVNDSAAGELVDLIKQDGGDAIAVQADVSNEDDIKRMFRTIRETYGHLDILVNNAGIMKNNLLIMTPTAEFDEVVATNCKGSFLCLQYAAKMMMRKRSGKIINLSSIVGVNGNSGQIVYSASKAFVIGMTKSAAKELGQFGISVNAVAPGIIDTDLNCIIKEEVLESLIQNNIAFKRLGTPEDVAKVIIFLSSSLGDYISGQVIGVDGCQVM